MTKFSSVAHRLHPRLRVIENGSGPVNACRSKVSAQVATAETADAATTTLTDGLDIAALQAGTQLLEGSARIKMGALSKANLSKRKKLEAEPPANSSFVNVIIDVIPSVLGQVEDGTNEAVARIAALCTEALNTGTKPPSIANVITRRNSISASVPVTFLDTLREDEDVSFVGPTEPLKLDVPQPHAARRPTNRNIGKDKLHKNGADVIIGIIDVGGFDFAHTDFIDDDGNTRFSHIWDQGGSFRSSPDAYGYGCEFRAEHLNAALSTQAAGGMPAAVLEPQSQQSPSSHATHVASIAAGNKGVCPEAQIAAVLIDVPVPDDDFQQRRHTFSDSSRIIHAVEYLLDIARAENKPISINVSLGTNGGAHDGFSGTNRWFDMAMTLPGRSLCFAAGNAGQEKELHEEDYGWIMGRIHASGKIASRGLDVELGWTVVGNGIADVSENELEIWYSPQDRFNVELLPPGDTRWLSVKPQEFIENTRLKDGTTVSIYNELFHPTNGENYIAIYLSPNFQPGEIRGIRAGVWRVRLVGEEIRNGTFHCWIERDDPRELGIQNSQRLFRFPSFFSAASNIDSHSISSLACGRATIAVSNFNADNNQINITSSQGPTRDGRMKPDVAGPGTDIVAANGFATGSEKWVSMSGTSMSSPYVAGVIGLMMNANPSLNSMQCIGILQRTAKPLPGTTYEWQNDAGFGRIDPEAAIAEAEFFMRRTDRT
ncbi:MAG: peptidase S8 and S53 subtilisin kexin sedolisin [Rhodobacteraceae bacterium]|nr:MAG: peptidase S8 and S53 subtilisin kexin sedolisin [Paracoccaceae bacterium]